MNKHFPLERIFFPLILFSFFILFYQPIETEDGWWHLSAGRWVVEHRDVPRQDVFSPTAVKSPWYLTQWLGSTVFYLVYRVAGLDGLMVFRALLLTSVIALFVWYARKKVPLPLLIVLMAFLWRGLAARNLLRPLIFNFLFLSLFLIILYDYRRTQDPKRLPFLPVLGVFWANLHLGSFVYGGAVIAAFFLGSLIEYALDRCRSPRPTEGLFGDKFKVARSIFFVLCAYQACFFITPYGIDGFLFPFKVFLVPDFIRFYKFKKIISEMASPVGMLDIVSWAQFFISAAVTAVLMYKRRKGDFASWVLFFIAVAAFFQSVRSGIFFVLISVYIIAQCWDEGEEMCAQERPLQSERRRNILMVFVLLAFGYTVAHSVISRGQDVCARAGGYAMPGNPQKAVAYLKKHAREGIVFADDHLGGYLIWSSYPHLRPFVDGRQMNQEYFQMYLDALERPQAVWDPMEERFGFSAAMFDMNFSLSLKLINHIAHSGRWRQAYRDRDMVVYLPRDVQEAKE